MPLTLPHRPIFVIGAERSGTTLVMTMLGAHPDIAVPEVAWFYPRFRPYVHTYGDLSVEGHFRTLVEEMVFGLKTPLWDLPVNPRTVVGELVAAARERSFAGAYAAILERYAGHAGKSRWGEKTPYNLFFIGEILDDFPQAQFVFITRDGRDASADYLESSFGPTNVYAAALIWKLNQQAVKPWREKLRQDQWLDLKYETLVCRPEQELARVARFLGIVYTPALLDFYKTPIAQKRSAQRDHAPLGHPVSDRYIGIHKELMSVRDRRVFVAVAGTELSEAGYEIDVDPLEPSEADKRRWLDYDARVRAATLDSEDGHIVYESYNDWLLDQREARRRAGVWKHHPDRPPFPIGTEHEELVQGFRAWRQWKEAFGVKRRYYSGRAVL
jgi:Sulfotransferase family